MILLSVGLSIGCTPRADRLDQLVAAGWMDRARDHARYDELGAIDDALWSAADVVVSAEVVPSDVFEVEPRGYGRDWWLVSLGVARAPGVVDAVAVDLAFEGAHVCARCGPDWIHDQLDPRKDALVEPRAVQRSGRRRPRTALGRLFRGVVDAGKVVVGLVLLPVAVVGDMTTTVASFGRSNTKPFHWTQATFELLSSGTASSVGTFEAAETGQRCAVDGPCSGLMVVIADGAVSEMAVDVELQVGVTSSRRRAVLPLDGVFESALAARLPSEGAHLAFEPVP